MNYITLVGGRVVYGAESYAQFKEGDRGTGIIRCEKREGSWVMSDSYTETTTKSWGSRIGESIKGVLFGFVLIIAP